MTKPLFSPFLVLEPAIRGRWKVKLDRKPEWQIKIDRIHRPTRDNLEHNGGNDWGWTANEKSDELPCCRFVVQ